MAFRRRPFIHGLLLCVASVAAGGDSPAPRPADSARREVELASADLAATPEKREQLRYLATCALPEHVALYSQQDETRFTFPGRMGLAPGWLTGPMTPEEERWVSACMYAMVNYFGKHVEVSFRANPAPVPVLRPSADERRRFSIFEGAFFGNLFGPQPVAYVCVGTRTPAQSSNPVLENRVCTRATGGRAMDGSSITPCGYVLTGACTDPAAFTVDGRRYQEVIFTYLMPTSAPATASPAPPPTPAGNSQHR